MGPNTDRSVVVGGGLAAYFVCVACIMRVAQIEDGATALLSSLFIAMFPAGFYFAILESKATELVDAKRSLIVWVLGSLGVFSAAAFWVSTDAQQNSAGSSNRVSVYALLTIAVYLGIYVAFWIATVFPNKGGRRPVSAAQQVNMRQGVQGTHAPKSTPPSGRKSNAHKPRSQASSTSAKESERWKRIKKRLNP